MLQVGGGTVAVEIMQIIYDIPQIKALFCDLKHDNHSPVYNLTKPITQEPFSTLTRTTSDSHKCTRIL